MPAADLDTARAEAIRGWMSPAELCWLAEMAARCKRVVEVGSFAGRSARAMADAMAPRAFMLCVDPLDPTRDGDGLCRVPGGAPITTLEEGDAVHNELCTNLSDLILAGRVRVVRDSSLAVAASLRHSDPFDFVFLDGDHATEAVAADIAAWLPLVAYGGYIAGHDYYTDGQTHPGVREAVEAHVPGVQRVVGSIWYAQVGA